MSWLVLAGKAAVLAAQGLLVRRWHDGIVSGVISGRWSVVVVGGRMAGASAAWALAPFAERVHYQDLPLLADCGYFSLGAGSVLIGTPSGPGQWRVSTAIHRRAIDADGGRPVPAFTRVERESHLGPAVAAGRRATAVGGAGYHLDPGDRVRQPVRLLRDRVAEFGRAGGLALDGLTELRDAALAEHWA